jgi:hypothetical protein
LCATKHCIKAGNAGLFEIQLFTIPLTLENLNHRRVFDALLVKKKIELKYSETQN